MKLSITVILAAAVAQIALAQSEELKLFDEYHAYYNGWLNAEYKVLDASDANVAAFQLRINKTQELWGQLERIAFTNILAHNPTGLDWTTPRFWASGFLSTNIYAELKESDPAFRSIATEMEALQTELTKEEESADRLRELRQQNQDALKPLERTFYYQMMDVQKQLDQHRKEKPQQGAAPYVAQSAPSGEP